MEGQIEKVLKMGEKIMVAKAIGSLHTLVVCLVIVSLRVSAIVGVARSTITIVTTVTRIVTLTVITWSSVIRSPPIDLSVLPIMWLIAIGAEVTSRLVSMVSWPTKQTLPWQQKDKMTNNKT